MKKIAAFTSLFLFASIIANAQNKFTSSTISIGVVVSDLIKAVDFYTNVVGMTETGGFDINEGFGSQSGLTGGLPFSVKILKLKDDESATEWKLMSFNKQGSHIKPKYIQDDTGVQYITIFVNKLQSFIDRIKENNVIMLGETPIELGDGRSFVLIQDPDGTFVELIGSI